MFKHRIPLKSAACLLAATALLFGGCKPAEQTGSETAAPQNKTVKIGVAVPLSGPAAQDGQAILNAVQLAVEEHNKTQPVKVTVQAEDDKSDPKEASAIASKFAGDPAIVGVIGNYNSAATLAAIPILTRAQIPQIAPSGSAPSLSGASPFFRKVTLSDNLTGKELAEWMMQKGYKKAALLYLNNDYGKGLADVVKQVYQEKGGVIVVDEAYLPNMADFAALAIKVKQANHDVVIMGSMYSDASAFIKQALRQGYQPKVAGPTPLLSNSLLKLAGKDAEGVMTIGSFSTTLTDPQAQAFTKLYRDKYLQDPSSFSAYAYDAANILLKAIDNAGADRVAINNKLNHFGEFDGVTGKATFDEKGDTHKPMRRFQVVNQQFVEQQ